MEKIANSLVARLNTFNVTPYTTRHTKRRKKRAAKENFYSVVFEFWIEKIILWWCILTDSSSSLPSLDSQKIDSCNEGGLNLISRNNNNNSNNNRNRTTSSNYVNEPPADDIDRPASTAAAVKSERVMRSSSRSRCETSLHENESYNHQQRQHDGAMEKSAAEDDDTAESATENEGDNNNNEDDEREEGKCEAGEDEPTKTNAVDGLEKFKHYGKKKKRRRRKRELTLKTDQSQQHAEDDDEDDDDEMSVIKDERRAGDKNDESDGGYAENHVKHNRHRRHSSTSDPMNLSISKSSHHQDDSDEANIDVETISNAPSKVRRDFSAVYLNFI